MGEVNVTLPSDSTGADVADYNTPLTDLINEFNGNIENINIAANAGIAQSKIAFTDWQDWTPSYTNITVGSGATVTAKYCQIGKTVIAEWALVLGTGGSISNGCTISFPVTPASRYTSADDYTYHLGTCTAYDVGTYVAGGKMLIVGGVLQFRWQRQDSTAIGEMLSTFPFTETTGDIVMMRVEYEAA